MDTSEDRNISYEEFSRYIMAHRDRHVNNGVEVRAIFYGMGGQCTHGAGDSCQTERAIYSMGREVHVNLTRAGM